MSLEFRVSFEDKKTGKKVLYMILDEVSLVSRLLYGPPRIQDCLGVRIIDPEIISGFIYEFRDTRTGVSRVIEIPEWFDL